MDIIWTEKNIALDKLKPYDRNPRRISKEAYEKLKDSIAKIGYHQRIVCQPDGTIAGGHQRLRALKDLGFKEVPCLVPNKKLPDDYFKQLLIQDNLSFGEFDFDILGADFEMNDLIDWGMPEDLLVGFNSDDEVKKEKKEKTKTCPNCGVNL